MAHSWIDGKAPNCDACGWLGTGTFPDGTPYEVCRWFANIFHDTTDEPCDSYTSPDGVRRYMELNEERTRKRR